jgi:diguanylate cyclase (GGDEF)-like protein
VIWVAGIISDMIHARYKDQFQKTAAMMQHLTRAVRASRAFFVFRDRSDPTQPQIVACHPPLSDDALMDVLKTTNFVCSSVIEEGTQQAWIGVSSDGSIENAELAKEMTTVVAQSLATELRSLALEGTPGASRDRETGLPDRDTFTVRVDHALDNPADGAVAILVVDLDRFQRVSARFADIGETAVVRELATRLQVVAEACDCFVARIGGDKFGVLLYREGALAAALEAARQIHESLKAPMDVVEEEIFMTASVGVVAVVPGARARNLIQHADLAISELLAHGGGGTLLFKDGMQSMPAAQLLRERDIRLAVSRNEFLLHFQPIVGAMRGGLHAFEALLRWRNPEEGLLPPSTFLDVLNDTGLIDVVGRRVIREACAHAARWMALSGTLVPVSVNVVPLQLYAEDFCDEISRILAEEGLPAEGLILELTEEALIDDSAKAHVVLDALRALGVRVFIDDFGTGYSSLSYLHDLPVTGIKMDQMFFRSIDTSDNQREIVRSIVQLAHFLNMEVIAEGIEHPNQLSAVQDLHCDFAQGYAFARPFDAEHATRYLAQQLTRSHHAA